MLLPFVRLLTVTLSLVTTTLITPSPDRLADLIQRFQARARRVLEAPEARWQSVTVRRLDPSRVLAVYSFHDHARTSYVELRTRVTVDTARSTSPTPSRGSPTTMR
jgi:hypothetical protein